jgi:hypothetical protein
MHIIGHLQLSCTAVSDSYSPEISCMCGPFSALHGRQIRVEKWWSSSGWEQIPKWEGIQCDFSTHSEFGMNPLKPYRASGVFRFGLQCLGTGQCWFVC